MKRRTNLAPPKPRLTAYQRREIWRKELRGHNLATFFGIPSPTSEEDTLDIMESNYQEKLMSDRYKREIAKLRR